MNYEQARFNMIEQQIRPWDVLDQDVLNLLKVVKREAFVPAAYRANIDPQMTAGVSAGMLTITGQVDHGSSSNKGMRLYVGMVGYNDGPFEVDADHDTMSVTYDTSMTQAEQPALGMMLKNIPSGTLEGSLLGDYHLSGDLDADVTLDLTFTGTLMAGSGSTVVRVPGTTHVTGTATSGDGVYMVDVTI